jgi:hypothetical protein
MGLTHDFALLTTASQARRAPRLPVMPGKIVNLALKRPVICVLHQTVAHWVVPHIQPFHIVTVAVPQLMVPKASLPDRCIFMVRPPSGQTSFPFSYPLPEWIALEFVLSGEKMNVVRQHYIASDCPLWCLSPCLSDQIMDFLASEYAPTLMGAGRYEKNDAKVADGRG